MDNMACNASLAEIVICNIGVVQLFILWTCLQHMSAIRIVVQGLSIVNSKFDVRKSNGTRFGEGNTTGFGGCLHHRLAHARRLYRYAWHTQSLYQYMAVHPVL
jgi:hypothetical protein